VANVQWDSYRPAMDLVRPACPLLKVSSPVGLGWLHEIGGSLLKPVNIYLAPAFDDDGEELPPAKP
jgi:hypothetical protein